jgi:hypothetical protein
MVSSDQLDFDPASMLGGTAPTSSDSRQLCRFSMPGFEWRVSFVPSGTEGWEDLSVHAIGIDIDGTHVNVAALDDIIRSKEAADRLKDRLILPSLRRLREMIGDS